jgi:excinuclease ABC subunit C
MATVYALSVYNPPVAVSFHFEHSIPFSPENSAEDLRAIPTLPGVFALHGPRSEDQPYLTRAADLRRRITRILAPPDSQSKRLNLRTRVARIDFTITGSEFESTLTLYHASAAVFGLAEARRRLRLHTPFFLRFTAENAYPRVYSTNRLSKRALAHTYGPFPSRAAADRYCDAVLDLFKLRRCVEELAPYPEHPGCVYGEMNKCLAPCNQACTPEGAAAYAAEAAAVEAFFDTHGQSLLTQLTVEREQASAILDFERAAQLHAQFVLVKAAATLADPLVQPIPSLRAVLVHKASVPHPASEMWDSTEPYAAIFLVHAGCITGPAHLSTLGVRAVKDQAAVGTSLFAQPQIVQAVPLTDDTQSTVLSPAESPEVRAINLIASLEQQASAPAAGVTHPDLATLSDHLSLLRRWYYRPEKQRAGEVFLPREDSSWPIRRILNAAARVSLGEPESALEAQIQQPPTPTEEVH